MSRTIGTCSNCGGRVSVPTIWFGTEPPIPECSGCGARAKAPWGPIVQMERHGSTRGMSEAQIKQAIENLGPGVVVDDHRSAWRFLT